MKKTLKVSMLSLTIVSLVGIAGVNAQNTKGFTIKGELSGLKDGDKVMLIHSIDQRKMDTVFQTVKNNRFELKGQVKNGADFYSLRVENKRIRYNAFLDNSSMVLKGDAEDLSKVTLSGSAAHDDYLRYTATVASTTAKIRSLNKEYRDASTAKNEELVKSISKQFDEVEGEQAKLTDEFIRKNPQSYYTANLIFNGDIEPSVTGPVYNGLSKSVKESAYGIKVKERLADLSRVAVGIKAPDFSALTPEGATLSLNEVVKKGKYTLIDFWASWCGPCRQENPNVVAAYAKFHEKGLNVLGVSLDKTEGAAAWKKAIADDQLTWYQISDLKYWQSPVVKLYAIRGIPHSVLVDAKGVIVAKDLRGKALHDKLEELLK
ncbi:Peroxiredoxin [Pedobacter steynii]|uniref:Peroxiredoxin n=1 Tax=Pedobacter steynii TaxID=430522 RepID=A0A1G9S686_9SPHI|nr:TlpA disulfide reductase family protein [Pedobacter steynii]NQX37536.1 AhpC/TSA family protein [Pedobacter steynii]SDM30912.1 Peroxiredoxin [Pedobacter steynii]